MCDSIVLLYLAKFINIIVYAYRQGFVHAAAEKAAITVKAYLSGSCTWYFIARQSRVAGGLSMSSSMFFKLAQGTTALVQRLFTTIFKAMSECLEQSQVWSWVRAATLRFEILLGIYIFFQTAIPHQYWRNYFALAAAAGLLIFYLVKCACDSDRYSIDLKKTGFTFILFTIILFLSAVTSITPIDSIRVFTVDIIPLILVLLIVNSIKDKKQIGTLIWFIISGLTIASFYGIWQYINRIPVDETLVDVMVSGSVRRAFSTMGNPNNYAEYIVMTLPFYAAAFFNTRRDLGKLAVLGLALLPLLNLFMTSSRSSWLGFAGAVFVFMFLINRKIIPLILFAGILAYPVLPSSIRERLATIGRDSSSKYRVNIWKGSFRILSDFWPTGIGLGPQPFMRLFKRYSTFVDLPAHSHMLPLQIWIETGIAGFIAFYWFLAGLVKRSFSAIFGGRDKYLRYVIASAVSAIAGLMAIGMFEYVWFYPRIQGIFWIVAGILIVSVNLAEVEEQPVKPSC